MAARTPTPQPFRQSLPPERTGAFGPDSNPPAPEPRRSHTLRMQAVQPPPKDRNVLVWVGAGLMILAAALGAVVWLRNPGTGAIEVRTIPARAKVVLDGIHRGEAPLRLDGVHTGSRRVEIRAEGYETVLREIELQKGATAMLDIVLTKMSTNTTPTIRTQPEAPPAPTTPAAAPAAANAAPDTTATQPAPARPQPQSAPRRPGSQRSSGTKSTWQPPPAAPSGGASWAPPSN